MYSRCWFLGLDWSLWLVVASEIKLRSFLGGNRSKAESITCLIPLASCISKLDAIGASIGCVP
jgi:hypothetical protein